MPEKQFIVWLDEHCYIGVDFLTVRGRIVSFVVRLMLSDGGELVNVARYDTAHGVAHRDMMGARHGLIDKRWFLGQTNERVLNSAICDFKDHHHEYIESYRQN